jgi:hypothetical protein
MFKFIKKLLTKKEKVEERKIPLSELDQWLKEKSDVAFKNLNEKIIIITNRINEEILNTKEKLELLKNAKLRNPNIPVREKQFMEGNREAYIKKVGIFLQNIKVPKEVNQLNDFCLSFEGNLETLGKTTIKPYHILQEFFSHESSVIAQKIKGLDNLVRELRKELKASNIDYLDGLRDKLKHIVNNIKKKEEFMEELEKKETEFDELKSEIENLKKKLENLKNTQDYQELEQMKKTEDELANQIRNEENSIFHFFSILEMAMKKFVRITYENEELLKKYIENPVETLVSDFDLRIIQLLQGMEKNMLNNKLKLKDKKREKTLEILRKLDKEFLNSFLVKYGSLKKQQKEVEEKISTSDVRKKVIELNNSIEEKENRVRILENRINNLKSAIDKIDIHRMKRELEEDINKISGNRTIIT